MGVEVSKTGIDWVDKQLKAELDNLRAQNFDMDKSIIHLKKVKNAKSYDEMMKKENNPAVTIMAVQILLKELGYTGIGKIDGILKTQGKATSKTMEAIKVFQRKNKLVVDGVPGPVTVNKLLEVCENRGNGTNKPQQSNIPEQSENVKDITEIEFENLCKKTSLTDDEVRQVVKYANKFATILDLKLTSINDNKAVILSNVKNGLCLNGLTKINDKQAESLSKVKELYLEGLIRMTNKQAEFLSNLEILSLRNLTSITDKQAKELAKIQRLYFYGDENILTPIQKKILKNLAS